jgi:LysR family transcriptional regulator, regulator for metE and metH
MDLEVRHLELVRAVSATGNLTKAGGVLHLTQSALSHQLRHIESRLGTALFLRVGKRMVLTPAGEQLLRSADDVLNMIERTEAAIRQLGGAERSVLRLTTECYTCYHWLPALLKRYRRMHPDVDVRIDAAATTEPIARLLDGRLDVAILSGPVRDRRVVVTPLFHDQMVVVVDPHHPLAARPYVRPEDLAKETLLIYPPKEESTIYRLVREATGVSPSTLEMQLTEATIELVKAGLGVSLLARWAVEPHVKSRTLRALPLTRRGYPRTWSAATLKDMARVPHIREFIDLVAADPPFTGDSSVATSSPDEPPRSRRPRVSSRRPRSAPPVPGPAPR